MVYVECKPDRELVRTIKPGEIVIHAGGKSGVCKRLENAYHAKGLVDEDPQSARPPYMDKLKSLDGRESVKLYYDRFRKNFLIVLCPRLEEWILNAVKELNIDLKDYNLPADPNKLHAVINSNLKNFRELLHTLKQKQSKKLAVLEEFLKKED
jgi:hypothetical protein